MKRPVSQPPKRNPLNTESTEPWGLSREWEVWFGNINTFSVDIRDFTPDLNPTSVSANTTEEQTFPVSGLGQNDIILAVNKPSHTTGLGIVNARVSATDTLAITFMNTTGSPIDPGNETYKLAVLKR